MTSPGLRERKKAATRAALREAALRLADEHGVEGVTVEQIAAAADVSGRTFFNHFATKDEVFLADDLARGRRYVEAVRAADPAEDPWPLLTRTALEVFAEPDGDAAEQALKERLVRSSPALLGQAVGVVTALQDELVEELVRRCGTADPLQPQLLAGAVVAALTAASRAWSTGATDDFPALLARALDALAPAFR